MNVVVDAILDYIEGKLRAGVKFFRGDFDNRYLDLGNIYHNLTHNRNFGFICNIDLRITKAMYDAEWVWVIICTQDELVLKIIKDVSLKYAVNTTIQLADPEFFMKLDVLIPELLSAYGVR